MMPITSAAMMLPIMGEVLSIVVPSRPGGYPTARPPTLARRERVRQSEEWHVPLSKEPMALDDPVLLTCAISGAVANRDQCPANTYTPAEYAAEARRAVDEGASMIHIHARTPDGTPSYEVDDFRAITDAILDEVGDVVINYSTGA